MNARRQGLLVGSLLTFAVLGSGCPAERICTVCDYKTVTVPPVPSGQIDRAEMTAQVTHQGACPTPGGPDNCTEQLTYNVKCMIKKGEFVAPVPMLIDGASTSLRKAWVTITQPNQPAQRLDGTLSATGTQDRPATPCPPPEIRGNPRIVTAPQ